MPLALEDLPRVKADAQMIDLTGSSLSKYGSELVQLNETNPQGANRLAAANEASSNPSNHSQAAWSYMVNTNTNANEEALRRSVGDPNTPTDETIDSNVKVWFDSQFPEGF